MTAVQAFEVRHELPPELRANRAALVAAARARLVGRSTPSLTRATSSAMEERLMFLERTHGRMRVADQAAELGISEALVTQYRQRLARQGRIALRARGPRTTWTPEKDQQVVERIGTVPHEQLAAELGTNRHGLLIRAKRLRISLRAARKVNADHLNAYDVARILGVDQKQVTHQIIRWGLLKAERHAWLKASVSSRGREGRTSLQWTVRRQDLIDFLIDYPWQYDRTRITDPFFRRPADEAWERDPLYTTAEVATILRLKTTNSVNSLIKQVLPKLMPRERLVLRRAGNPRAAGRSLAGMQTFVPRSTLRAIQASGWRNKLLVARDREHPTVEMAAKLLSEREDRPGYVTRGMLRERLRRFYKCGAIATTEVKLEARGPWLIARSMDDVLAMLPALFARSTMNTRITPHHRALLRRHEPELLKDPRALLLAQATGELTTRLVDYWNQERRAEREFRLGGRTRAVYVAPHVARTLDVLGNRTRYVGRRHGSAYHLQRCVRNLVAIPLKEARRHALRLCAHCDAVAKERGRGQRSRQPVLIACSRCGDAFPRQVGRPAKHPRCARCKAERPVGRAA